MCIGKQVRIVIAREGINLALFTSSPHLSPSSSSFSFGQTPAVVVCCPISSDSQA